MDFFELVERRESCRAFSKRSIPKDDLERIVEAARLAPSATNQQPWHFYVITDEALRDELSSALQKFNKNAQAFIVIVEDKKRFGVKTLEKLKRQTWTSYDIGIAASHISLAATELDIGSCILGWFKASKVKDVLGLDESDKIRLIISLGYKEEASVRPKTRKSMGEVSTWM